MMRKIIYSIVLMALAGIFLTACSSNFEPASDSLGALPGGNFASMPTPASVAPLAQEPAMAQSDDVSRFRGADGWEEVAERTERHLIKRAQIEAESETFDETVAALRQLAPAMDGYIESESLTAVGRPRLSIVLRVPSAHFDEALRRIEDLADVRSLNQSADDVTDQFFDLQGNLETRRIEEDRILALIEQADNIYDLLALESRLSNVRLVIESYLSQLNQMAGQIAYSTITVMLTCSAEPVAAATATLGERIGGAFGDSVDGTISALQGVVVFLAGAVIPLLLLGLVGLVAYAAVRAAKKRVNDRGQPILPD